jgi:3-oxoacyl-[acyl-carrier protein] reductase
MASRRVLVTGATRGLGKALVEHWLAAGDQVVGCGRGEATIDHERYTHYACDVTDAECVAELFNDMKKRHGQLDVLVNNAGIASMNSIALTPVDAARRMIETNFLAAFNFTREALRLLRRAPSPRVVNLTTVAVPLRLEGEAVYAASKSALETFTRIAAREIAPLGITCNGVGPCPVETALTAAVPRDKIQALIDRQAVHRWASPEDVVNVIDFFLRPESSMVTGQIIYLGGIG